MLDLQTIKNAYFIGIGGIGMSALARYFRQKGVQVSGYDRTPTPLTGQLQREGIAIHYEENTLLIPLHANLVVYTPAIPRHHAELAYYIQNGYTVLKRSEVLELITRQTFTIAVAGSHGKTTVTSLIAHILTHSGYGCTAFVGGIMANYNSNFIPNNALTTPAQAQQNSPSTETVVVEADEFDRSFLRLYPNIAVITAVDTDHLDIYGSQSAIEEAFADFAAQIKPNGLVIVQENVPILPRIRQLKAINCLTYSNNSHAKTDFYAQNIRLEGNAHIFDITAKETSLHNIRLYMDGLHNIENAVAAAAVALQLGIEPQAVANALNNFKGIKRRFEYIIKNENIVFIDDYAHHPQEINALLTATRKLYPNKKITAIFQPHLYTRTRDLATQFAQSLDLADEIFLLDIYPAREEPIQGVSSDLIFNQMQCKNKKQFHYKDLLEGLKKQRFEVVLSIGAGNIDALVDPIKNILSN